MKTISTNPNQLRLTQLNNRYDLLIELNQTHHYTCMVMGENGKLIPNPKEDKYTNLLLRIRAEKQRIWAIIRRDNQNYQTNVNNGIKALVSLTKNDLFKLTSPMP